AIPNFDSRLTMLNRNVPIGFHGEAIHTPIVTTNAPDTLPHASDQAPQPSHARKIFTPVLTSDWIISIFEMILNFRSRSSAINGITRNELLNKFSAMT